MIRRLYTVALTLLLPLMLLRLLWRSRHAPDYRQRWAERFGQMADLPRDRRLIWIHAVSVGETLAAVPLVRALQQRYPHDRILLTTTTPTGSAQVTRIFAGNISAGIMTHCYLPYDLPCLLNRFLNAVQPRLLVIMETELWPNLLHLCSERTIPVVLANARLSEKSARGYHRLGGITHDMLQALTTVAVQNHDDGERFVALGLPASRLQVTGSLKFDLELTPPVCDRATQLEKQWRGHTQRRVWLAASTHRGEDEIVLAVQARLRKVFPDLLLVLVPRHPERFDAVFQLCIAQGFRTQRLRENTALAADTSVLLGDTMGDLLACYGACDVAFVGGSLVPVGGHNLIEPAAWGKPVLSGPHLHNFADVARLLREQQALSVCVNVDELLREVTGLLDDDARRHKQGERALQVAEANRGALQHLLAILHSCLAETR